jgi:hypothetical protein
MTVATNARADIPATSARLPRSGGSRWSTVSTEHLDPSILVLRSPSLEGRAAIKGLTCANADLRVLGDS